MERRDVIKAGLAVSGGAALLGSTTVPAHAARTPVTTVRVAQARPGGFYTPHRAPLRPAAFQRLPVAHPSGYGTARDTYNRVTFTPVRTTALRIEVQLRQDFSAGILEWRVEA